VSYYFYVSDISAAGKESDHWTQSSTQVESVIFYIKYCLLVCAASCWLDQMYFSCHRSLISDALLVRCWQVQHITAAGKPTIAHKLKKFAKAEGTLQQQTSRLLCLPATMMLQQ
jgi:hypothetical protein